MFTTRVSLSHTTIFTYSHANTPFGQSERAYYLRFFYNRRYSTLSKSLVQVLIVVVVVVFSYVITIKLYM